MDFEEEEILTYLQNVENAINDQIVKMMTMRKIIQSQDEELRRYRKREQLQKQRAGKTSDIIEFKRKSLSKPIQKSTGQSDTLNTLELQDLIKDLQSM